MSALESPALQEAHEPPEAQGLARDNVRLLVADRGDGSIVHSRFSDLPRFLQPGDLVVVNTSATLAAALSAVRRNGSELELRLSTPVEGSDPERFWIVELRSGDAPFGSVEVGELFSLPGGASAEILAPYAGVRLWLAHLDLPRPLSGYLEEHGSPIRYGYVPRSWPLSAYQNVYALEPGSAEMPSAGRPFTTDLITRLVASGVVVAPIVLHTGVSSQERHERPYAERYRVPAETAWLANAVHGRGGRVIATGTTVVRALETVAGPDGFVAAGEGWTNLIVTPERGVRAIDGLITGLHELESSHLDMLRALGGDRLVLESYDAALEHGYRWHEFGDSQLILGGARSRAGTTRIALSD